MNKPILRILLLIWVFGSCIQNNKSTDIVIKKFKIPILIQENSVDTFKLFEKDMLSDVSYPFFGKFKFSDTLYLENHLKRDTTLYHDFIFDYCSADENDSISTDGFQIFVDYQTTLSFKNDVSGICNYYYPVYVVNETCRTKLFIGKDGHAFGIQEAIDTSEYGYGEWRPIESEGFDFCGNGYFSLNVHPSEFIIFLVPKYDGSEKQLMRIRLNIGGSIYITKSFEGTFNSKQFEIKKNSWINDQLKENKSIVINRLFYGAIPKGYD